MPDPAWTLPARIAADTFPVGDLPLCRVLLAKDANYPWLMLVPRRTGVIELMDFNPQDRSTLSAEIDAAARAVKSITECDKINIAAFGNVVPDVHVHVIGRRHSDAAWPKPVWGVVPAIEYEPAVRAGFVTALRQALGIVNEM